MQINGQKGIIIICCLSQAIGDQMLCYDLTIYSLKPPTIPASTLNLGAGASEIVDRDVDLPFFHAAREDEDIVVQFAPHRMVRSYAEYRRLNAGKSPLFG